MSVSKEYKSKKSFKELKDFSPEKLTIRVASPKEILEQSYGEIENSETVHYRTFQPQFGGLLCPRIFGPTRDYECECGLYKNNRKGIVCEKCGVEVISSYSRRTRMAHIELMGDVINPIYLSYVAPILDIPNKFIDRIISFSLYVVTKPGNTQLSYKQILDKYELEIYIKQYGKDAFTAETGSSALRTLLSEIDLELTVKNLREELQNETSEVKRNRKMKAYNVLRSMKDERIRPEWMILRRLPVMPADLRPIVALEDNVVSSDLNPQYQKVLFRNKRLQRFSQGLKSVIPEEIIRNEHRMLLESIFSLFVGDKNQTHKPIADHLIGKMGIPRSKLEGKRLDFSARAVVIPNEQLKLNQCGVPKDILKEIFRLHLYERLQFYGISSNIKTSKQLVDSDNTIVYDLLTEVVKNKYIMLNRAPTLFKLGIQSFEIVITEGNCISLHPLLCVPYNADFDGDCTQIYGSLGMSAQLECRELVLSEKNILSPVSGKVIITLHKDMVLGCYELTMDGKEDNVSNILFSSLAEIEFALMNKKIDIHTKIFTRYDTVDEEGKKVYHKVYTTPGRMMMWNLIPKHHKITFDLVNKPINNKQIQFLMDLIFHCCGGDKLVKFADNAKDITMKYAYLSGISFGKADLVEPEKKDEIVEESLKEHRQCEEMYNKGLITWKEMEGRIINIWQEAVKNISSEIKTLLESDRYNNISKVYKSGARGSLDQIRQLIGIKGLPLKDSTSVFLVPIISNMVRGIPSLWYFYLTKGGRDGAKDRALNTATSGYLSRRIADLCQGCITKRYDCGTKDGILAKNITYGSNVLMTMAEMALGRVLAEDVISPVSNQLLIAKNTLVTLPLIQLMEDNFISQVKIRSLVTCEVINGKCCLCYGIDDSTGDIVDIGVAIGIIAGQAVGEPATQLVMKTFTAGGTASGSQGESSITTPYAGKIKVHGNVVKNKYGHLVSIGNNCRVDIVNDYDYVVANYDIKYGSVILAQEGGYVEQNSEIISWDTKYNTIIAEQEGEIIYNDIIINLTVTEHINPIIGTTKLVVSDKKVPDLSPSLTIKTSTGEEYTYPLDGHSEILVKNKSMVHQGDILVKKQKITTLKGDILDGLAKLIEITEIRSPTNPAILATVPGKVKIENDLRNKKKISILCGEELFFQGTIPQENEHLIMVRDQEEVEIGNTLVSGDLVLQNVLRTMGKNVLVDTFLKEVQVIYKSQGIQLSNKHLEVLLSQMLRRVKIISNNNPNIPYVPNELVDAGEITVLNNEIKKSGGELIKYEEYIGGITATTLNSNSFLTTVSFQDPIKRLATSSLMGETDNLLDIKSRLLLGDLIPVGTGHSKLGAYYSGLEKELKNIE